MTIEPTIPEAYPCRFLLPIRLAFPTCPRARWSRLTRAYRPATTVANCAPLAADMPARIGLQLRRASSANQPMTTLLWSVSAVYVSRLLLGHRFGAFPAPGGTRSSASRFAAPLRVRSRFLPKQVCKPRHKTPRKLLSGPSQKADLRPWEPGPLAWLRPV